MHYWRMFLAGYVCSIYQRAVRLEKYGHDNNPGHLDLWSAAYLPLCEVFVTHDKRQRRALKIINMVSKRRALRRIASGGNLCCRDVRTRRHDNPTRTLRVSRHRELHQSAVLYFRGMLQP